MYQSFSIIVKVLYIDNITYFKTQHQKYKYFMYYYQNHMLTRINLSNIRFMISYNE